MCQTRQVVWSFYNPLFPPLSQTQFLQFESGDYLKQFKKMTLKQCLFKKNKKLKTVFCCPLYFLENWVPCQYRKSSSHRLIRTYLTKRIQHLGISLVVQWLRVCASITRGVGSNPVQENKILCSAWQGQITKIQTNMVPM